VDSGEHVETQAAALGWSETQTITVVCGNTPGGERGHLLLDDVDDHLDERDGVLEADRSRQLDRRGFEHHVRRAQVLALGAQPLEELPDSGLRHQRHHRPLLGGEIAEPGQPLVHARDRLRRKRRRRAFDVLNGGGQIHGLQLARRVTRLAPASGGNTAAATVVARWKPST
jgi:hypothetical protein